MERLKILELIQLDVIGSINQQERLSLRSLMESEENFPWIELAEYQNLIALLPSVLISESPAPRVKDNMIKRMNSLILGEEAGYESKTDHKEEILLEEHSEKIVSKGKIDWGSLSIIDSIPTEPQITKKAKFQLPIIDKESISLPQIESSMVIEEFTEAPQDYTTIKPANNFLVRKGLRKYVLISVILFILSAIFFIYLYLKNTPGTLKVQEKINKPMQSELASDEKNKMDSLIGIVSVDNVQNVEKKETPTKMQTQLEVLPKAPPKLPDPIDAPLIEVVENTPLDESGADNNSKAENEISQPPQKEIIEIEEEPTYFVAVEEMPEPINGLKGIQEKIVYPEIAKRAGIEGKVFVRAFVDETGTVTKAEVVKGIGGGCDEAALDAVLKTKFKPGKQRGKPIKVQVTISIVFRH
jgi:protein TonB